MKNSDYIFITAIYIFYFVRNYKIYERIVSVYIMALRKNLLATKIDLTLMMENKRQIPCFVVLSTLSLTFLEENKKPVISVVLNH